MDKVYLNPNLLDCKFAVHIPAEYKNVWYADWWAQHIGKPATIVSNDGKGNLHIQFDDDNTKYVISSEYLKPV